MNEILRETSAKGRLVASGVLDIFISLYFLVLTGLMGFTFIAFMVLAGTGAAIEDSAVGVPLGVLGGLGAAVIAVIAVIMLILFIVSIAVTVKTFKISKFSVEAAKQKTGFLNAIGILQIILGALFLIDFFVSLGKPDSGATIAMSIIGAGIALACGILKLVSAKTIKNEKMPDPQPPYYGAPGADRFNQNGREYFDYADYKNYDNSEKREVYSDSVDPYPGFDSGEKRPDPDTSVFNETKNNKDNFDI